MPRNLDAIFERLFQEDMAYVIFDRPAANTEQPGNLFITEPARDISSDAPFRFCQCFIRKARGRTERMIIALV